MPLQIFDHPTVQRLMAGEIITVQELREACVDFLRENKTFAICADCPHYTYNRDYEPKEYEQKRRDTGCCGHCLDHQVGIGCTRRNISCLAFTCKELEEHLRKRRVWPQWNKFRYLFLFGPLGQQEPYFNYKRLPDAAPVYAVERGYKSYNRMKDVALDTTEEGVMRNGPTHQT